jgi:hypothetical protein
MTFTEDVWLDEEELRSRILSAKVQRIAAASELRAAQINPSPADVEAYVASTPRQKHRLMMAWAVLNASYG